MRIIKVFVLSLIILVVVVIGGAQWAMQRYAKHFVDDMSEHLGVRFMYNEVTGSLDGSISLHNARFFDPRFIEPWKIERVDLSAGNVFQTLYWYFWQKGRRPSDEFHIRMNGIKVDYYNLYGFFDDTYSEISCGASKLTRTDFGEMGYSEGLVNADVTYKVNEIKGTLNTTINVDIPNFISYSFESDTELVSQCNYRVEMKKRSGIPKIELHVKNFQFLRKLTTYCAKKESLSLDEYVDNLQLFEEFNEEMNKDVGIKMNDEFVSGLNDYVKNPKDLYFSIDPAVHEPIDSFRVMTASVVEKILNPTLRVNGSNVNMQFDWVNPASKAEAEAEKKRKEIKLRSWERALTPFNQLNDKAYNKDIEVQVFSGTVYKGRFTKTEGSRLHMTIHTKYGASQASFDKKVIKKIYVITQYKE